MADSEDAFDVAVVGSGMAGRRVAKMLTAAGRSVALAGRAEPVWGIDVNDDGFSLYRSKEAVPSDVLRARVVVLATGATADELPEALVAGVANAEQAARLGFRAESALGRSIGCRASWLRGRGGWVLDTDDRMRTSVAGILAVGGAIGASDEAEARRQADAAVATLLGSGGPSARPIDAVAEAARETGAEASSLDEVLVCPCEGITLGQLRSRTSGYPLAQPTSRDAKLLTRLGMGECQGRICGHRLALIDENAGRTPTPLQPRSPVIPLRIPGAARKEPS